MSSYRTELQYSTELGTSNTDLAIREYDIYRETENPCPSRHENINFRGWARGGDSEYLCGFKISVDVKDTTGSDDYGIIKMEAYFCSLDNWSVGSPKLLYEPNAGSIPDNDNYETDLEEYCPTNKFVVGAEVQVSRRTSDENDPRGLVGLRFWCNSIENEKEGKTADFKEVHWFDDGEEAKNTFGTGPLFNPNIQSSYITGVSTQNGYVSFEQGADCNRGATGVLGLRFETTEVILGATVSQKIKTWTCKLFLSLHIP